MRLDRQGRWNDGRGFNPSYFAVCQTSHFTIASAIVYGSVAFGGPRWLGLVLVLAWSLPKDLAFDVLFEDTTWQAEGIDVCFYLLGALAAFGSLSIPDLYRMVTFG